MTRNMELDTREKTFVRHLRRSARLWHFFRWFGVAGALTLMAAGTVPLVLALRQSRLSLRGEEIAIMAGGALVLMGFVLLLHIVAQWQSHRRDQLLLKLIKENSYEAEGSSERKG